MREACEELSQFLLRLELGEDDLCVQPGTFKLILHTDQGLCRSGVRRTKDQSEARRRAALGSGALDRQRYGGNMPMELGLAKVAHPSGTDHNAHLPLAFVELAERQTLWRLAIARHE